MVQFCRRPRLDELSSCRPTPHELTPSRTISNYMFGSGGSMKKFLLLISVLALVAAGCAQKPATNTASSTPKPAASPAAKTTKKLPENKVNPVPADWITMSDEVRGYEFKV